MNVESFFGVFCQLCNGKGSLKFSHFQRLREQRNTAYERLPCEHCDIACTEGSAAVEFA